MAKTGVNEGLEHIIAQREQLDFGVEVSVLTRKLLLIHHATSNLVPSCLPLAKVHDSVKGGTNVISVVGLFEER